MVSSAPPEVQSNSGNDDDDDDAGNLINESINKMQIYLYLLFLLASGLEMAVNLICLFHSNFQIWFRKQSHLSRKEGFPWY